MYGQSDDFVNIPSDKLRRIKEAIFKFYPQYGDCPTAIAIPDFNDHPDTTFEDIKKVLEEADV